MTAPNLNYAWAQALLDACVDAGAAHAVVCPGSRSAPLAVSCAQTVGLRTWSVVDERSAGFFALGLARSTGRPAVLVATSGSAGAHFLPALIEAAMSHVPLVVLTADRPWELQGFGAPQTIPQQGLFGGFVRRFEELLLPEASPQAFAHLRAVVARAVATAKGPSRGAVHLNVPFREPLAPTPAAYDLAGTEGSRPRALAFCGPARLPDEAEINRLATLLLTHPRGVIVCGPRAEPDSFPEAVWRLGRVTGYPVIADGASGARFGAEDVVAHIDLLLQNPRFAHAFAPELVLKLGGGVTSKRLQQWLDAQERATCVLVSEDGGLVDPSHRASQVVSAGAAELCDALSSRLAARSSDWREGFVRADRIARGVLEAELPADGALSEPAIARVVAQSLPADANLFVSSSMPVREVEAFASPARPPLRVFANRGANGIDGITSTALGVSAGSGRPTALLTGDLAFLHDLGGLLTARRAGVPLSVVVVNNDGGGIFSFLPIASATPHFEGLFVTPHGLDLSHAAQLFGATFSRPTSARELRAALTSAVDGGGLCIIEVQVPREENVPLHRRLGDKVARALDEGGIP